MPDEAFLPGLPGPDDDTRLLRRLKIPARYDDGEEKRGLFVDCETTGFDSESEIELAAAFVLRRASGRDLPRAAGRWLHDPGKPIPAEITRITGIDDAMVAGKKIDNFGAGRSDLIVAALPFCLRRASGRDLPWRERESNKLRMLGFEYGFFYDSHRALADCEAGLHLLAAVRLSRFGDMIRASRFRRKSRASPASTTRWWRAKKRPRRRGRRRRFRRWSRNRI